MQTESFSPQYLQPDKVYKKGQWTTLPAGAAPSLAVQIIFFKALQPKQEEAELPSRPRLPDRPSQGPRLSPGCSWAVHTQMFQLLWKQRWCQHYDASGAEGETDELKLTSAHGL